MSTVMNEGVNMIFRAARARNSTVVGLLVEPITSISKPKGYLESYPFIRQPYIAVTSSSPVIPPSLVSSLFLSSMLKTKGRIHQSRG